MHARLQLLMYDMMWTRFFSLQAFQQYIEPTMQHADIVVPQGAENEVAMRLIVQHIKNQLKKVSVLAST